MVDYAPTIGVKDCHDPAGSLDAVAAARCRGVRQRVQQAIMGRSNNFPGFPLYNDEVLAHGTASNAGDCNSKGPPRFKPTWLARPKV
jgi:hypothetical protein